ncbi:hypothetical protein [Sphingomonas oleivorans]|uniref:hypothetical protein n=1 Tax=Sphingomonas oleivorans TaxID=1735121 RepID=UPI001A9D32F6|nr:hypothetical protein [Sphingomonas oleivorans]
MEGDRDWTRATERPAKRRRPLLTVLMIALLAFAGGLAAAVYALTNWDEAASLVALEKKGSAPPPAPRPVETAPMTAVAPVPQVQPTAPELEARIGRIEEQLQQIDIRASAASGNADRAEGLLLAFAARRALDRGVPLGYMEGLLRERFGGTEPQAVAAVIAAARQPVTLEELQTGLERIAPKLAVAPAEEGWWAGFRRELGQLIVVRRSEVPSAVPADRLARARRQLEGGHVDLALAEVARLPGHAIAADWIAMARRYSGARNALDRIETAALLQPHPAPVPAAPAEDAVPAPAPATPVEPKPADSTTL